MLKPIELPDLHVDAPLTSEMETLLQESDRRIDDFLHHWRGPIIENFVASDYRTVNNVLHWIVEHQLNAGNMFCEWGSGFGVVTLMASLHNFTAFGIEVEAELESGLETCVVFFFLVLITGNYPPVLLACW